MVSIRHWGTITAIAEGLRYSESELTQKQDGIKQHFEAQTGIDLDRIAENAAASQSANAEGSDLSDPEESAETQSDSPDAPTSKPQSEYPEKNTGEQNGATGSAKNNRPDPKKAAVESILNEFYTLQNSYTAKLDGCRQSFWDHYRSMPRPINRSELISVAGDLISKATALERECDSKVKDLLTRLRAALKNAGMDSSLANEVENYYVSQKNSYKAILTSKYAQYF